MTRRKTWDELEDWQKLNALGKSSIEGVRYAKCGKCGYAFNDIPDRDWITCNCGYSGPFACFSVWWRPDHPWKPSCSEPQMRPQHETQLLLFVEETNASR